MIEKPEISNDLPRHRDVTGEDLSVRGESAAWACVVYSLVPFLGILFVPVGLGFAFRDVIGGRRSGLNVLAASLAVLTVQIVLWWLLYAVPGWSV